MRGALRRRRSSGELPDDDFSKELKGGQVRVFAGRAGDSIFVDPAACYHYGSRCKQSQARRVRDVQYEQPVRRPDRAVPREPAADFRSRPKPAPGLERWLPEASAQIQ